MPLHFDVALLHAPSVYDFRNLRRVHYGPISDVIPSRPVFDMYPVGFTHIASYLEKRGVKTGIFNIAARMLNEPGLDVPKLIKGIKAALYAVDIHWLVHAHGAVEVAKLVKEVHGAPVAVGGFSATYYWREILEKYPFIDFVVLGDTTEPVMYQLLHAVEGGDRERLYEIPNLAFRDGDKIVNTGIRYVPQELDDLKPDYTAVARAMIRSGIRNSLPWSTFFKHPIAAVISYKGCPLNCLACGGSNYTYRAVFGRGGLGRKSPRTLVEEFREITDWLKVPVFFVGDLQYLGRRYLEEFTELLRREKPSVELIFEFFTPPPREVLSLYRRAGDVVYLQISPESHDEDIRKHYGRPYDNSSLLKFIKSAAELRFERVDLYFMVGLPMQTPENVKGLGDFFLELAKHGGGALNAFVAPLAPFVDPGSPAFHNPSKYGYVLLAKSFEEHRRLLLAERWYMMLNYETTTMTRSQIAEATYNAVESLAKAKYAAGVIDDKYLDAILETVKNARNGVPPAGLNSKETVREEELYPKKFWISYLTPRSVAEIIRYSLGRFT
ncbi:Fe-S oxidoreductase [Pyrobaculum oguniense TE7]|uniref:Fe-S oxidoreductase n=1 Tax=Pyrobaculum oguniense (strain DSM 13380 / JCM 10595 / TE7) TaxID=698757 RepID=H6QBF6_PYROT|nr:Fe-S oxidoreductase [Pyrobaculum oguniense TE7]